MLGSRPRFLRAAGRIQDSVRKRVKPTDTLIVCTGYTLERANAVLAEGLADLVAFGQLFLANPDLPTRFKLDAPLNKPNPETYYSTGAAGYTDYPALETV